jgi:propanol-preferring alcohol dehydrogenase
MSSVAALGPGVDPLIWKIGDRAGLKPIFDVCHACEHCRGGAETLCDRALYAGGQVNGSYAEVC